MPEVKHTPQALADLDDIWMTIASSNVNVADRVIDRIAECLQLLAARSEMGNSCGNIAQDLPEDLRHFTVLPYPYVLFYKPMEDGIVVYRILHGHRDLPDVFRRELWEGA